MTPNEVKVLEVLLGELEQAIVQKGMPKSHLHNIRDLRSKTIPHFYPKAGERNGGL